MTIMRPFIQLCKAFYISTRLLNAPLIMCLWLEKVLVVFVYSIFLFGFAGLYGYFVEDGPFAITAAKKRQHGASDFIHILSVWIMQPHSINKHLWPLLLLCRCGQIVENKLKLIMHQLETDKHENKAWQMRAAINLEMNFIYYRGAGRRDQQKVLIILLHSALMNPYPDCLITADPRPYVLTEGWCLVIK